MWSRSLLNISYLYKKSEFFLLLFTEVYTEKKIHVCNAWKFAGYFLFVILWRFIIIIISVLEYATINLITYSIYLYSCVYSLRIFLSHADKKNIQ